MTTSTRAILFFLFGVAMHSMAQNVQSRPELLDSASNSVQPGTVVVSPDGSWIATGGIDRKVRIFDATTGGLLRVLTVVGGRSGSDQVLRVAVSPDGRAIAAGTTETGTVWDVDTGRQLWFKDYISGSSLAFDAEGNIAYWDIAIHRYHFRSNQEVGDEIKSSFWVSQLLFTPDGKEMIVGNGLRDLTVWDLASKTAVWTIAPGSVTAMALSPNGKLLAVGGRDHSISIWDLATGSKIQSLTGHTAEIRGLAFDKSAQKLVSCGGMLDGTVRIWDLRSGTAIKTFSTASSFSLGMASDALLDPAGQWVGTIDGTLRRWNLEQGTEIAAAANPGAISEISFDANWRWIISRGANSIRLWDTRTGQMAREFRGPNGFLPKLSAVSPDDDFVVAGFISANAMSDQFAASITHIETWTLLTDSTLAEFDVPSSAVVSRNGRLVAGAVPDTHSLTVWDARTGTKLSTMHLPDDFSSGSYALSFSPEGNWIYVSYGSRFYVWDWKRRKLILNVPADRVFPLDIGGVSEDGRWAATVSDNSRELDLFDLKSAGKERKLRLESSQIVSGCPFDPTGTFIACKTMSSVEVWRVASGTKMPSIRAGLDQDLHWTPEGELVFRKQESNEVTIWDVASNSGAGQMDCSSCLATDYSFSPDGHLVAAIADNSMGNTKLFDRASGKLLATLSFLKDSTDWLIITPDGLFDGTPSGWRGLSWRFQERLQDVRPVEVYFSEFFHPGLLGELMRGDRPAASSDIASKDRRQPKLSLKLVSSVERSAMIEITAEAEVGVGVRDIRLFREGTLVKIWHDDAVLDSAGRARFEFTVKLSAGENHISAYAFNHDNVKSNDAQLLVQGPKEAFPGKLFIVSIGVNRYSNASFNLSYAVQDATSVADELTLQQTRMKRFESTRKILLLDENATRANILKTFADLAAEIEPEDGLVVFFAGHGVAKDARFYLTPHDIGNGQSRATLDASGLKELLEHAVSDTDLETALEPINAKYSALIIDACNSGQALQSMENRRGPMNSAGLAQLAYEKGMSILTAAQSYQQAVEPPRLGHGLLTYVLVEEGLKEGAADTSPKDAKVTLQEWFDFATLRVPTIDTKQRLARGVVSDEVSLPTAQQQPRVFYRRDPESDPLVVGIVEKRQPNLLH